MACIPAAATPRALSVVAPEPLRFSTVRRTPDPQSYHAERLFISERLFVTMDFEFDAAMKRNHTEIYRAPAFEKLSAQVTQSLKQNHSSSWHLALAFERLSAQVSAQLSSQTHEIEEIMELRTMLKELRLHTRPVMHLHMPHSGGSALCQGAQANGERLPRGSRNCIKPGDLWEYTKRSCDEHLLQMREVPRAPKTWSVGDLGNCQPAPASQGGGYYAGCGISTFTAMLRGFETDEFCPEYFDYILIMRHPIQMMQSFYALYNHTLPFRLLRSKLEQGVWRGNTHSTHLYTTGVDGHFIWSQKDPQEAQMDMGTGSLVSASQWHNGSGYGMAMFDNLVVRFLAARTDILHAPLGSINETHYQLAKRNLARFALASALEDVTASTYRRPPLYWHISRDVWTNSSSQEAGTRFGHHAEHMLNKEQLAWLAERNAWDIRLWESLRRGEFRAAPQPRLY